MNSFLKYCCEKHKNYKTKGEKKMRKRMRKTSVLMVVVIGLMVIQFGCGGVKMTKTGFISDYSKLLAKSDNSMVYVDDRALGQYGSFIVDPVQTHFLHASESGTKLTSQEIRDLRNYLHGKLVEAVRKAGKQIVFQPARGVARIRAALTDMKETDLINLSPIASVTGTGVGGASIEFEIVDSMTGKQIAAVIESKSGSRIPLTNLGEWGTAKGVMDNWAERLQQHLQ